jgi:hypothetical protein
MPDIGAGALGGAQSRRRGGVEAWLGTEIETKGGVGLSRQLCRGKSPILRSLQSCCILRSARQRGTMRRAKPPVSRLVKTSSGILRSSVHDSAFYARHQRRVASTMVSSPLPRAQSSTARSAHANLQNIGRATARPQLRPANPLTLVRKWIYRFSI